MRRTVVLNVVGLTDGLFGAPTPRLTAFRQAHGSVLIRPAFPAVTCTGQANYLTGAPPARHGVVGNGWYNRELAEVQFWKQSGHLLQAPRFWEDLRRADPGFTCAQLFWWFNMYSGADYSITPRPSYPADGRKVFDIYTWPYAIRPAIKRALGEFPFPTFWGPAAGVESPQGGAAAASEWIAASARWIEEQYRPTLSLVYLPHLDYGLQRLGPQHPDIATDLGRIDGLVDGLIAFFRGRGVQVVVLSEYGLTAVDTPVHLNRLFRERGWLVVKEELGLELLDAGASRAFAVADHQVAHLYLNDPSLMPAAREAVSGQAGVEAVLGHSELEALGLNHPRTGDLVAVARPNAWFTYYYWLDDARAPDFARTLDIHRKPGYDPVELFLDPAIPAVKLKILWRLLQKRLGFRMLMDVIPLDARLVRGSHGRQPDGPGDHPVLVSDAPVALPAGPIESTEVAGVLRRMVAGEAAAGGR